MVLMIFAIEWRLPVAGAGRSALRSIWALGIVTFLVIGAVGMSIVIGWLNRGDADRQFALPRWLTFGRGTTV